MIARKTPHAVQVLPPIRAGRAVRSPHRARVVALLTTCALVATCAAACANTDANQVTSPVVIGMTNTMAPFYSDGQLTIYEAQAPVSLPVRRPTEDESKGLGKADPYSHAPFLLASDVRTEVRFTLSNIDDQDHKVELLLDPWNEFVRYRPGVQVVSDEETAPNFSGYDRFVVVPAKSRLVGTITSDDTNEMAIDLATAEAIVKDPPQNANVSVNAMLNHVFNLQNRSNDGDPLITPYIPKVIAGLTGFDLGVRTYEQANVAVEIVIDVTDMNGNRVLPSGSSDKPIGPPGTILTPPPATAAM